jgi:hypothetical protein
VQLSKRDRHILLRVEKLSGCAGVGARVYAGVGVGGDGVGAAASAGVEGEGGAER